MIIFWVLEVLVNLLIFIKIEYYWSVIYIGWGGGKLEVMDFYSSINEVLRSFVGIGVVILIKLRYFFLLVINLDFRGGDGK